MNSYAVLTITSIPTIYERYKYTVFRFPRFAYIRKGLFDAFSQYASLCDTVVPYIMGYGVFPSNDEDGIRAISFLNISRFLYSS